MALSGCGGPWLSLLLTTLLAWPGLRATDAPGLVKGTQANLQITGQPAPFPPTMSQGLGKTQLRLLSAEDGRELWQETHPGRWSCLGFSEADRTFLLGVVNQQGAWLPLVSIQRLREDGTWAEDTAFDREQCLALAAVVSPSMRYIVFVGGRHAVEGLFVLDLKLDTIRKLGRPPAPPPAPLEITTCSSEPFRWGTCWADGFVDLDDGILRFPSADVLEVSYGKDGPRNRASHRQVRRFNLALHLATQHPKPAAP